MPELEPLKALITRGCAMAADSPASTLTANANGSEPLISIERKITCPTYCNRLHVTQTMALQLLPRVSDAQMKVCLRSPYYLLMLAIYC